MFRSLYKSSPRLRRAAHRGKDIVLYWLARLALSILSCISLPRALRFADVVADLAYRFLGQTRRLALSHLELVYGEAMSVGERQRIVRGGLRNVARNVCELVGVVEIVPSFDDYVEVEGWQHAEALRDRGAVMVSGHLGNWELLAAYFAAKTGLPVAAVARQLDEHRLNRLLIDYRARGGVETILRESPRAGRQLLSILKRGGLLAMVIDQDTRAPSVTVPFLGHPARTPFAPAALAIRRGVPLMVTYAARLPSGRLRIVLNPPIPAPASGDRNDDIIRMTELVNDQLSAAIRDNPESWVWWHRRWRRKPIPELDMDAKIPYPNSILSDSEEVNQ